LIDTMRILCLLAGLLIAPAAVAADPLDNPRTARVARLANADEIRKSLGLLPDYAALPRIKDVKVAVLDFGFAGADRPYLPKKAIVVEHYDRDFIRRFNLGDVNFIRPLDPNNAHGRYMAQLVWAMTGNHPDGPQFYLLNANGPTMFRRAVRFAIELKVDIILFSGTFEGAGNYDGRGPINAAVDEAVAAGIIWINAAGNTGGMVYNGPVDLTPHGNVRLGTGTALRFSNRFDENTVTITLTWNDYRDIEDLGTDKDLDLVVEDVNGREVGASRLKQVPPGREAKDGETKNPRERVVLTDLPAVSPGQEYRIRVRAKGGSFGPRDRLRILVAAERNTPFHDPRTGKTVQPVELFDATRGGEIYPPADHAGVLTVGDRSSASAVGPTADGRVKPDVGLASSVARFTNGEESGGSSNAAAYFAGAVAAMRSVEPSLTTAHIRQWVRRLDSISRTPDPEPPPPSMFPSRLPPPPPPPGLSPNQARALRYAEGSMEDNRRQKGLPPYIVMSSGSGTYLVRPDGSLRPGDGPPGVASASPAPAVVRGQAPQTTAIVPASADHEPPHSSWVTPAPKALKTLVNGR
jgi:hypothetical protein